MKKQILAVIFSILVLIGVGVYFKYGKGLRPAIGQPKEDIVDLLEKANLPGVNRTDWPLVVADGLEIGIFAKDTPGARVIKIDPKGNVLVSLTQAGDVVVLTDGDKDGKAEGKKVLVSGLNKPHGLELVCETQCQLYVAETDEIMRYDYSPETMTVSNGKSIVNLPGGGRHFTRTLLLAPPPYQNKMLVSIGSSCDVCEEKDSRVAKVMMMNLDGSGMEIFGDGLRNSVFMVQRPGTQDVWATEMGRDHLGDNLPPDEVNVLEKGKNYGWPYCYGQLVHDDQFDSRGNKVEFCNTTTPARVDLPAHSAPLGLTFVPEGKGWSDDLEEDLLVAYHGSWNRSEPTGYKIVRQKVDGLGNVHGSEDFISGWLDEGESLGRPVDLVFDGQGNLLVSDDKAGVIYIVKPLVEN